MTIITVLIIIIAFAVLIPLFVKYSNLKYDVKELNEKLKYESLPTCSLTISAILDNNQILYIIKNNFDKSKDNLFDYEDSPKKYTSIEEAKNTIANAIIDRFIIIKESVDIETITFE